MVVWWSFCGGGVLAVVFLWWCGGVFVAVWWCGVFLWWCFCGGVFVAVFFVVVFL